MAILIWFVLLVICWPLALVVLLLAPLIWLLALPFRALGIVMEGFFALLRAILLLPSRFLAGHDQARH